MRATFGILPELLRVQLWLVPSVMAALAAVAALALIWVESQRPGLAIDIDAESARAILTAISGAMISFTALVFSVTMLVLQLASTQLSPRVARSFLRDRFNQSVLGLFVATFVFSLLLLTSVAPDSVPQLGVIGAIALVLAAMLAFVAYLDHMAHAIRPTSVLASIITETTTAIDANYPPQDEVERKVADLTDADPEPREASPGDSIVTWSGGSGYVQAIDTQALLAVSATLGHRIDMQAGTGQFLAPGMPLLRIRDHRGETTHAGELDLEEVMVIGDERTMSADPEFGFRQVVDVALRALSPSLNDPTTANQAIDRLHQLLLHLQTRFVSSPRIVVGEDDAVVRIPQPDWDALMRLSIEEIEAVSRSMPPVSAHLREALTNLAEHAKPGQQAAISRWLAVIGDGEIDEGESE